ncbi:MAG: spore germination protein, partial [Firmicutes bacterium]|nr:spore germination protein [Bacillota bacterium]
YNIGSVSKADVVFVYMKDRADPLLTQKIKKTLEKIAGEAIEKNGGNGCPAGGQDTLSVADQSLLTRLLTALGAAPGLNPFPKVRYTQRPDLVAAHLAEGKAAIITDNSPTVMLIPVSIFEFFQDVDDYYFPQLTGNYFRLIRILNFALILFLTPVYLLITQYEDFTPDILKFFVPEEDFAIPIFWQFVLLELAVDALKLASLNTPSSLGMSLSVIGALILGEFSINSGWFIPQTILCMAVVALAGFTQPSIELSYAMKFCRIFMLVGAGVAGIPGVAAATVISTIFMASTKTIPGKSYLYPLIPFHWNQLKRLIFRTQK